MKPAPTKQRGRAVRDAAANWFRQKAWLLSDQTVSCCKTLRADTRVASLLVTRFDSGACPPSPAADRLTLPKHARTSITAMCRSVRLQSVSASRTTRIRGAGIAASIRPRIRANIRAVPPPRLTRPAPISKLPGACFLSNRTEADFQAWRDARDWTAWKYAMWERGERLPSQNPNSMMTCPCGEFFDSHDPEGSYVHRRHVYAAKATDGIRR